MGRYVSLDDKKDFIRWVLKKYQMKRRESVWILNYMVSNDQLLENTHFVEEVQNCPKGIVMTTAVAEGTPFRFYYKGNMTADAEKAFHDIRVASDEPLYVQVNFRSDVISLEYLNVLEETEFHHQAKLPYNMEKEVNFILKESQRLFVETKLNEQIDLALDKKDEATFYSLISQLKSLQGIQ